MTDQIYFQRGFFRLRQSELPDVVRVSVEHPTHGSASLGHCQHEESKRDYHGKEVQFIGFDELTEFTQSQYEFIALSRTRSTVPELKSKIRSASNPLRYGIWDAFEGQVFSELSDRVHGCEPFDIPPDRQLTNPYPLPETATMEELVKAGMLKVGDTVMWSHAWGTKPAKPAVVQHIEICAPGEKHGNSVTEARWSDRNRLVVDLENGSWAYGDQLEPISPAPVVKLPDGLDPRDDVQKAVGRAIIAEFKAANYKRDFDLFCAALMRDTNLEVMMPAFLRRQAD